MMQDPLTFFNSSRPHHLLHRQARCQSAKKLCSIRLRAQSSSRLCPGTPSKHRPRIRVIRQSADGTGRAAAPFFGLTTTPHFETISLIPVSLRQVALITGLPLASMPDSFEGSTKSAASGLWGNKWMSAMPSRSDTRPAGCKGMKRMFVNPAAAASSCGFSTPIAAHHERNILAEFEQPRRLPES